MTWLVVLGVLVVCALVGWVMHLRRHRGSERSGRKPMDVRDVQASRDAQDMMRSARSDWRT